MKTTTRPPGLSPSPPAPGRAGSLLWSAREVEQAKRLNRIALDHGVFVVLTKRGESMRIECLPEDRAALVDIRKEWLG